MKKPVNRLGSTLNRVHQIVTQNEGAILGQYIFIYIHLIWMAMGD